MKIQNITIRNFRSIYGEQYFDFESLKGLVKLSGVIGTGKTSLGEALLWGLFGKVKEHKNPSLVSWHVKSSECSIEINLISKNKQINIKRSITDPLEVMIDGKLLSASNKRDTQEILEEEYYDVPKLAIEKMCIISFNAFKNSLASMNPGETRSFLDDVFGFKTFTEYNNQIVIERKNQITENEQLNTILNECRNQIQNLKEKKIIQTKQLQSTVNTDLLSENRKKYIDNGVSLKKEKEDLLDKKNQEVWNFDKLIKECQIKMTEAATLGKQAKDNYNTFKSGKCPTCGHDIDPNEINNFKDTMNAHAIEYREQESKKKTYENEKLLSIKKYDNEIEKLNIKMDELRQNIINIDAELKSYNDSIQLLSDNYADLIKELEDKIIDIENKIQISDKDIGEWNDMNELFSKTLRYSLLDTLIPHINKSIKYYLGKLNQMYNVEYDQEFKPHIYFEGNEKEISYSDLSTGQKKTLDIGIIFGVIANVISNVEFNIFFLDELFSNMDANSRNIMLELIKDNFKENKTIFIVNHAEMSDDFFDHKIRVKLENKKIIEKKEQIVVYSSNYEKIF